MQSLQKLEGIVLYTIGASVEVFYVEVGARSCIPMVEAVGSIVAEGLGVELWTSSPTRKAYSSEEISRIRDACQTAPAVSAHTGIRTWRPNALKQELEVCSKLGVSILVVHGDTLGVDRNPIPPDYQGIANLAGMAKGLGVTLALENGGAGLRVLASTLEKIGDDPRKTGLGICVDMGHAYGARDRDEHSVCDYLQAFKDQLIHIHVHDVLDGRDHAVPGDGELNWQAIAAKLFEIQFGGCLMLELLRLGDPLQQVRRSREFLLDLFEDRCRDCS